MEVQGPEGGYGAVEGRTAPTAGRPGGTGYAQGCRGPQVTKPTADGKKDKAGPQKTGKGHIGG